MVSGVVGLENGFFSFSIFIFFFSASSIFPILGAMILDQRNVY